MRKWLTSGFWAIVDQGAYAGTNFIVNIALARWLPPDAYGAFAVAYAAFVFFVVVHTALVLEPFIVFHPGRFRAVASEYVAHVLVGQLTVGLVAGVLLSLIGLVVVLSDLHLLAHALFGAAIATPLVFTLWFLRRACYACERPAFAGKASLLYMLCSVAGLYGLFTFDALTVFSSFVLLGLAALPICGYLVIALAVSWPRGGEKGLAREFARAHGQSGRWSFANNVLYWMRDNAFYVVLPIWTGLEGTAVLRALSNLVIPFAHVAIALSTVTAPILVRNRGSVRFNQILHKLVLPLAGAGIVTWLVLVAFDAPLVELLYRGKYVEYAHLLVYLGCLPLAHFVVQTYWTAFLAIERPQGIFRVISYTVPAGILIGTGLIWWRGIDGAAAGWAISFLLLMFFLAMSFYRQAAQR